MALVCSLEAHGRVIGKLRNGFGEAGCATG